MFVHNHPTRFVVVDRDILGGVGDVEERWERHWIGTVVGSPSGVWRSDVVVCWFASWHSLLPLLLGRFLGRPSLLMAGGYDTAAVENISYGHQLGGVRRVVSQLAARCASIVAVPSAFSAREIIGNVGVRAESVRVVHLGVTDLVRLTTWKKERMALTVASGDASTLERKGLRLFVETARLLPDVRFIVAGRCESSHTLEPIASPNVEFTGWLDDRALGDLYARSSVYLQLSEHEAFGLSVAEAMLGGCIAIVRRVGALPEVVGDTGHVLEASTPVEVADCVRHAMDSSSREREAARLRVLARFGLDARRQALHELINELVSAGS
jgi:glycosyltransferase involved in cell wall biosynthesis